MVNFRIKIFTIFILKCCGKHTIRKGMSRCVHERFDYENSLRKQNGEIREERMRNNTAKLSKMLNTLLKLYI